MSKDLICGMEVDEETSLKTKFEGNTYYFCSVVCKNVFEKEPHRYVDGQEQA